VAFEIGQVADVDWAPRPNRQTLYLAARVPDSCTAVIAFVITDGRMLLTEVASRGWDIPGGHRNEESSDQAIDREVLEETGLALRTKLPIGYMSLHIYGPRPAQYQYPYPTSDIGVFAATVNPGTPAGGLECTSAAWVPLDEVRRRCATRTWLPYLHYIPAGAV